LVVDEALQYFTPDGIGAASRSLGLAMDAMSAKSGAAPILDLAFAE